MPGENIEKDHWEPVARRPEGLGSITMMRVNLIDFSAVAVRYTEQPDGTLEETTLPS